MKKMFVLAIMMIGMTSFAQEKSVADKRPKMEKLTPEQRNEKHLKKLTEKLSLTETQQKEVGKILAEQAAKREATHSDRKKMMEAEHAKRKAEMEANDAKIKAILTPEQSKKWEALKAEKKQEFKERKEKRKDAKEKR